MASHRGAIRLPGEPGQTKRWFSSITTIHSLADIRRVTLKSLRVEALPLRIRPAFVLLTFVSLVILALLGFHPTLAQKISPPIPFSDKLLHFVCFFFASAQFYAIWVVDDSRRDWYWRYFPEVISVVVCLGFGSIGSEFVQGLLPYKTFQYGDVIANLLGTTLGIYLARTLTVAHRRSVELRRLYQPLDLDMDELLDSDADSDRGEPSTAGMNPIERGSGRAEAAIVGNGKAKDSMENPWDDGEGEIFGLGDHDEEDDGKRIV